MREEMWLHLLDGLIIIQLHRVEALRKYCNFLHDFVVCVCVCVCMCVCVCVWVCVNLNGEEYEFSGRREGYSFEVRLR